MHYRGGVWIPLIYLCGNFGSKKPVSAGFSIIEYGADTALYFCFCASFLCYSAVLLQLYQKDRLFYLVNGLLLFLPFVKIGWCNDLCMRASVPATFLLMVFCINGLFSYLAEKQKSARMIILSLLLCIGMYYPITEMYRVLWENPAGRVEPVWQSISEWAYRDGRQPEDTAYNYFTYDYDQSVFFRYFARK